ncbi:MAG TPA: lipoate protein ligase C-terminal domain-containing protein, partial [Clostridia bacterium]|nr:lipoate protein ligase C-terminal domain-containing protein [Clostridia bacterium]
FQADGAEIAELRPEDREAAGALANTRYRSRDWNWGVSLPYAWQRRERLPQGGYEVSLEIEDGVIRAARLQGDFMAVLPVQLLTDALAGVAHTPQAIEEALRPLPIEEITGGLSLEVLCGLLV